MTFLSALALGSFLSASAMDGVTTHLALSKGAAEANPLLQHEAVMFGVKAANGVATAWATQRFEHEHPRATRILLVIGTGFYVSLAAHNYSIYRQNGGR